jgi:hypothetical protein
MLPKPADAPAAQRRPLVEYGGEDLQRQVLFRVGAAGADGYLAASPSEVVTLGNLYKRGWVKRERVDGRWLYTIRVPEPDRQLRLSGASTDERNAALTSVYTTEDEDV